MHSPSVAAPAFVWLVVTVGALSGGCSDVLGIDGRYVVRGGAASGGAASGGAASGGAASGGAASGGAASGGASSGGAGGVCEAGPCSPGTKCCSGACVTPAPGVGCSLGDCTPCPTPIPNAEPLCVSSQCSARCASGYVPYSGSCVLATSIDGSANGGAGGTGGSGGTGGTGGAGGTSAQCNPNSCPDCTFNPKGPVRCCMQSGSCSCSWFNVSSVGYCL